MGVMCGWKRMCGFEWSVMYCCVIFRCGYVCTYIQCVRMLECSRDLGVQETFV